MSDKEGSADQWGKPLGEFITALVLFAHAIVFFQLVVCSKNMVVAFNIPTKNIGIYVSKLSGMRSLLMSVGGATEYGIYQVIKIADKDNVKKIRKCASITSFTCLTLTRLIFLIFLYYPDTVSFRNYIVLIIGAFFVGSFQISAFSLAPHVSALSWLSVYLSGIFAFVVQAILDMCWSKRPSLTFKIQSWIALIVSIISVGSWAYNLFFLGGNDKSQEKKGCNGAQQGLQGNGAHGSNGVGGSGAVPGTPTSPTLPKIEYLISMTSMSILKIMINKFDEACQTLAPDSIVNVQILITRLQQITQEGQITYDVLVAIDLVILSLKKCSCSESQLCLLAELSLFLRIKVLVKTEETKPIEVSSQHVRGHLPVETLLHTYPAYRYPEPHLEREESIVRAKRSATGEQPTLIRRRRNANGTSCQNGGTQAQSNSNSETTYYWISPFLMFGSGSLVKDFLFPGVIPYGLLERDKCHLINLIVIIFLSIGPITIYVMDVSLKEFKSNHMYYHGFWSCMIPKILILIISLCAIHTKQGCTHQIRSSRWRVFLMTMILLTCYGFLETVNIVGVPNVAKGSFRPDLIAINNIFGKFVRYFVYKLSVGYNKTRISAGFVLPNFKPPEPIPNTFCYWFKGAFSNGWKDIKGDFKMGIKQYLAADQTVSKKSPLESLRYCDLLM